MVKNYGADCEVEAVCGLFFLGGFCFEICETCYAIFEIYETCSAIFDDVVNDSFGCVSCVDLFFQVVVMRMASV